MKRGIFSQDDLRKNMVKTAVPTSRQTHTKIGKSIDVNKVDGDRQFMVDKHYADLRIKLGAKKSHQPGRLYNIGVSKTINDVESLPSDDMNDQWAAINNYDYEQWIKEEK